MEPKPREERDRAGAYGRVAGGRPEQWSAAPRRRGAYGSPRTWPPAARDTSLNPPRPPLSPPFHIQAHPLSQFHYTFKLISSASPILLSSQSPLPLPVHTLTPFQLQAHPLSLSQSTINPISISSPSPLPLPVHTRDHAARTCCIPGP